MCMHTKKRKMCKCINVLCLLGYCILLKLLEASSPNLHRGCAPGSRWGTSVPRPPLPPTSSSWRRHCFLLMSSDTIGQCRSFLPTESFRGDLLGLACLSATLCATSCGCRAPPSVFDLEWPWETFGVIKTGYEFIFMDGFNK